ncbi:MAG: Crp/Fnr family transcriptional regulator [Flavobacteriales bacterium]
MIAELKESYGQLFEDDLLDEINEVGVFKEFSSGDTLIDIGSYIRYIPLLLSGAIKILRYNEDGDELLLYFLERGDTCAVTLSCCMGQTKSDIRAVAEMDTKLVMIPINKMEEWIATYKSWRNFAFQSYHNRLQEMLEAIDSIAFLNMDERLIRYLLEKSKITKENIIQSTHQEIAYELHTSRVVISRLLKQLEKLGKIELYRNKIKVLSSLH